LKLQWLECRALTGQANDYCLSGDEFGGFSNVLKPLLMSS
jgi:hypothetical protein